MDDVEPVFFTVDPGHLNPFEGRECVVVDLKREVSVSQLADEIEERVGHPVQVAVVNARPGTSIEPESPARMYLSPVVDEQIIAQVVNDHVIDSMHGMSAGQREKNRLAEKLKSGEELTAEEMTRALRLILTS